MDPLKPTQHHHSKLGQLKALVARVSDANRPDLESHVEYGFGQGRMTVNGMYSFARPVAHADEVLAGKPFRDTTAHDWLRVVSVFRGRYSPQSLRVRVVSLRKHVRYVFGVDDLEKSDELGRKEGAAMEWALKVKREKPQVVGQVIPESDYQAMRASVKLRNSMRPAFPIELRDRSVLSTLRRSGFRVAEAMSLKLCDVRREIHEGHAMYRLALDPAEGLLGKLKTGPRTIYVQAPDAVADLDAWLAVHPFRDDSRSYVYITAESTTMRPLSTDSVRKLVAKAVQWAGIRGHYNAALTPHDFRHTCATEKAEVGWNEFQMCEYFGWMVGSRTPGIYVHLNLDKQRARILADAQRQAAAATAAAPQSQDAVNALLGLLKQAMGQVSTSSEGIRT